LVTPEDEPLATLIESASKGRHDDNERLLSHEQHFSKSNSEKYPLTGLFTKKQLNKA
jgi:hypothetical protein